MVHKFAVDPDLGADWSSFAHVVLDQCGVSAGRLVARYPLDWKQRVHKAAVAAHKNGLMTDMRRNAVERFLNCQADDYMWRRVESATYSEAVAWLANAVSNASCFRAIIACRGTRSHDNVLAVDSIHEDSRATDRMWVTPRQTRVRRTGPALVEKLSPLFQNAREFVFVDRLFDPLLRPDYLDVLRVLASAVQRDAMEVVRLEYHTGLGAKEGTPLLIAAWQSAVRGVIPRGLTLTVAMWRHRDLPHERYVLTDIGGVMVDAGLDAADGMTAVTLLERKPYDEAWDRFTASPSPHTSLPIDGSASAALDG